MLPVQKMRVMCQLIASLASLFHGARMTKRFEVFIRTGGRLVVTYTKKC
jgi:hypothetical protein